MSPNLTQSNLSDQSVRDRKPIRDRLQGKTRSAEPSNFQHLRLSQLGRAVTTALIRLRVKMPTILCASRPSWDNRIQNCVGMLNVVEVRHVFQITSPVVRWLSEFMVYLVPKWTRPKKGSCDQLVYADIDPLMIARQRNPHVSIFGRSRLEQVICARSLSADNPSYTSQVANRILSGIDRAITPFFRRQFFSGKFLFSHCGNLLSRFAFWLGSFTVQSVSEPFCILAQETQ